MTTKADRDLEEELGPSPWPIFADDDEPHKDFERLLKLERRFDYQYEIAHVLGVDASKISYWLQKAHEWNEQKAIEEGGTCARCGTDTIGKAAMCPDCLDAVRDAGRGHDLPEEIRSES